MKWVLPVLAVWLLAGCGSKPQGEITVPSESSYAAERDPDTALHEQLRAGSVEMTAAADTISEALEAARRTSRILAGEARESALTIVDLVDAAGRTTADLAAEPPAVEDVKKEFAAFDDERKRRITEGNDAYMDLQEAVGIARGLEADFPELKSVGDVIEVAMKDLSDAISSLGGQVEEPGEGDPAPEG